MHRLAPLYSAGRVLSIGRLEVFGVADLLSADKKATNLPGSPPVNVGWRTVIKPAKTGTYERGPRSVG